MKALTPRISFTSDKSNQPKSIEVRLQGLIAATSLIAIMILLLWLMNIRTSASNPVPKFNAPFAKLSERISVKVAGRGNPWINLSDGRDVMANFSGPQQLVAALENNQAEPLSLASADFDEDGVPDLISGYASVHGGIVTLMRGNVDSIYPNAPGAQQRRAEGTYTDSPFLGPAYVFAAPEAVDFIAAGDFDGDGHWDVVTAARGADKLYLFSGNGRGNLRAAKATNLYGKVTSIVAGEINRRDGLDDLVVGVVTPAGAHLLVFEGPQGALRVAPETISLPSAATSLAFGQLDDEYTYDLAAAAGNQLLIVYGRDRKLVVDKSIRGQVQSAELYTQSFPFEMRSIAIGRFTGDDSSDIALLGDDDKVHLLARKEVARQYQGVNKQPDAAVYILKPETLGSGNCSEYARLIRSRVSGEIGDNLLILDPIEEPIKIFNGFADRGAKSGINSTNKSKLSDSITELRTTGQRKALLQMRLNSDALDDLVVLKSDSSIPTVAVTSPHAVFVVSNTNDNGPGSLRQAIINANNNSGMDQVSFNIPGAPPHTINLNSDLPEISESITLDATTQPGFMGKPVIELNGFNAIRGLLVRGNSSLIRGLVVNRTASTAISLFGGADNIIEGNYVGTDLSGTEVLFPQPFPISFSEGGIVDFGINNKIGGTTANARNIVVSHLIAPSILISGKESKVEGNFIDRDVTGSHPLGRFGGTLVGTQLDIEPGITPQIINNIVGGMLPGAGNLAGGITIIHPISAGNLIQGNLIGTDKEGLHPIGGGVFIFASSGNTVGGPSISARNIITSGVGIEVPEFFLEAFNTRAESNIVQSNFIGVDINGREGIGSEGNGVEVASGAVENFILDNRIASFSGNGIFLPDVEEPGKRIVLQGNLIYSNGKLGIDLGQEGITLNDPGDFDDGPNELQNFPDLGSFTLQSVSSLIREEIAPAVTLAISGTFNSTPNSTFTLEFFFGSGCSSQGAQFIGALPIRLGSIPDVRTDANGNAPYTFSFNFPSGVSKGFVNGTATNATGNTSELSACFAVTNPAAPRINGAIKSGKKLTVEGSNFQSRSKILLNGQEQKTKFGSASRLIGKKAGKNIKPGDRIQVRNSDGTLSDEFIFQAFPTSLKRLSQQR